MQHYFWFELWHTHTHTHTHIHTHTYAHTHTLTHTHTYTHTHTHTKTFRFIFILVYVYVTQFLHFLVWYPSSSKNLTWWWLASLKQFSVLQLLAAYNQQANSNLMVTSAAKETLVVLKLNICCFLFWYCYFI